MRLTPVLRPNHIEIADTIRFPEARLLAWMRMLMAVCLVWIAAAGYALADDDPPTANPNKKGYLLQASSVVDDAQKNATDQFHQFVFQLDDFFGSGQDAGTVNKSWARFRLDVRKPPDATGKLRASVKLRLVLPRSEKRFRLLLSTEEDNTLSDDTDSAQQAQLQGDETQDVSLALRFVRSARKSGSVNFDIGTRSRDSSLQLFARLNTAYKKEIWTNWTGRVGNSLYHFSKSGYEDKLSFDLQRPIPGSRPVFFRTNTAINWRKGSKGASIGETLGIYTELSRRTALAVELLSGYSTALNEGQSARYSGTALRLRFRQNVWRPWFFYEIWPSVGWPSTNDYERAYGVLLRVEFVIGQT
jgi:hypothetical protein